MPRHPRIIAHRGASLLCPENTLAAFAAALRAGADAIELDVQLSSDAVPVVFHDGNLGRRTGKRVPVRRLTLRQLQKIDNGSWFDPSFCRERIPTLQEVFKKYGKKTRLFVEIKVREKRSRSGRLRLLTRKTVEMIRSLRLDKRVSVLSYDARLLRYAHALAPRLRYHLNLRAPLRPASVLGEYRDVISGVGVNIGDISGRFVRSMHKGGLAVFAFTCNTKRQADRALRAGADGLMSDNPLWLRRCLAEKGIR